MSATPLTSTLAPVDPTSAASAVADLAPTAAPAASGRPGVLARALMLPIRAWRLLSVHLPPRCRFHPSCSQYALEALEQHGAFRGAWLAIRRVGRCHPWHEGGLDPVPPAHSKSRPNVRSLDAASPNVAEGS